jgi:hypothetical protein
MSVTWCTTYFKHNFEHPGFVPFEGNLIIQRIGFLLLAKFIFAGCGSKADDGEDSGTAAGEAGADTDTEPLSRCLGPWGLLTWFTVPKQVSSADQHHRLRAATGLKQARNRGIIGHSWANGSYLFYSLTP